MKVWPKTIFRKIPVIISCLQCILASSLCDDGHVSSFGSLIQDQYHYAGPGNLDYQATDSLQQDDPHYLENPENPTFFTLQPIVNVQQFDQSFIITTDVTQPIGNVQQLNQNFIDTTDVTQSIGNVQQFNQNFINTTDVTQPIGNVQQFNQNFIDTTDVTQPIGNVQQFNQNFINTTDVAQPIGNVQQFNQCFINEVGIDQGQAVQGLSTVYSVWGNNSPNASAKPFTCQPKEKTENAKRLEKCRLKKKTEDMNVVSTVFRYF
ncbi:uncharacterized protein LOC111717511 [Eurytemora carolleeae]|uniref:uncharacterized protein LOC111717511 n=1 Tax=Eurytemora carolleeae TaxID=1294199 RepID=UPI000C75D011|nr:uncharacterized protein LOC111717511 [Eurytemora carolleeae]|eukprot:XP_023348776.1 uncharacterized protein LOC111717511 [Eurytemora affinis]